MSLPSKILERALSSYVQKHGRGSLSELAKKADVPPATISRIANGKQESVTYKIWKKIYEVAPSEIPSPEQSIKSGSVEIKPVNASISKVAPMDISIHILHEAEKQAGIQLDKEEREAVIKLIRKHIKNSEELAKNFVDAIAKSKR